MALTRKQFLLGGLAAATTTALLDACTPDEDGRDTFGELDDELGTSESESTSDESTSESESSTSEDDTTSESESTSEESTSESTSEESTSESTSEEESTSESTEETDTGEPVCPSGASGTVLDNHGHELVIPAADIQAGVQKVYDIKAGANHSHTVTLTPADFEQLALGNQVDKQSSFLQAHDHLVLIACLL